MTPEAKSNFIKLLIILGIVVLIVAGYLIFFKKPAPKGLEVPQLQFQSNPLKGKVPVVNPIEKTNPFQYQNPLR